MNNEQKITINLLPYSPFGGRGALKKMFMKKIIFFFLMWLATSCATVKTTADRYLKISPPALSTGEGAAQSATAECTMPPVYYTGNDEPAASSLQGTTAGACPVYYTGNNEPAASGFFLAPDEAVE
jgi:hypothetical protein